MEKTTETKAAEILGKIRNYFEGKSRVYKVLVFGSYARGTQDARSDIDILVVHDSERRFFYRHEDFLDLWDLVPLSIDLLSYTPEEWERIKDRLFFQKILKEGVTIYEQGK